MPASCGTARPDENVITLDPGCDRSVIGRGWKLLSQCNFDDEAEDVGGVLAQMSSAELPLVSAVAKIACSGSNPPLITVIHQALCDDNL